MNLEQLTALEDEWLAKQPHRGFAEERDILYQQIGMYEAWQRIFREYVVLAREGDLEALKRAFFLYWYSVSEPSWLNGIRDLDEQLVKEVLGRGDDLARKNELDTEFKCMLVYYYSVAEWYIDSINGFDELKRAGKESIDSWEDWCRDASFGNRGQLGQYWTSIQANHRKDWEDMGARL
jgi:hypothetical protein